MLEKFCLKKFTIKAYNSSVKSALDTAVSLILGSTRCDYVKDLSLQIPEDIEYRAQEQTKLLKDKNSTLFQTFKLEKDILDCKKKYLNKLNKAKTENDDNLRIKYDNNCHLHIYDSS